MVTVNMVDRNGGTFPASADKGKTTVGPNVGAHLRRPRVQPGGQIHVRQSEQVQAPDIEKESGKYIALALVKLHQELAKLPTMIEDNSRPFDEYNNQSLAPESESSIILLPQWEVTEKVESILITGPASAVTLQLGDRVWALTIPASGFLFIGAPLAIYLGRDDPRILTAQAAGNYSLELMGHCDTRGNLI